MWSFRATLTQKAILSSTITLPNTLLSIGNNAFQGSAITTLTIPDTVTHIGAGAFRDGQLQSVTLGTGLTNLGSEVFRNNRLTSVAFNGALPGSLGTNIFTGNSGLGINDSIMVTALEWARYRSASSSFGVAANTIGVRSDDINLESDFIFS